MSSVTSPSRTLLIASDHAGFELKSRLIEFLGKAPFKSDELVDLGPSNTERVDYPDYAGAVCHRVLSTPGAVGILICGSGQGMAMSANRHRGIRAALVWNEETAKLARAHNNANVLCLGGRLLSYDVAEKILRVFLTTDFEGGRHRDRIEKIDKL